MPSTGITCTTCCYKSLWWVKELLDMPFYIQIIWQNLVKVCYTIWYHNQSLSFGTVTLWWRDNEFQSPLQNLVVRNLTEPDINVAYLTTTSFVCCSMSCESSVPSSAQKCFSTTCWSSLLRLRGILSASFDSKARAAERTCFRSGTSSTWNAKFHTFRHKWQFITLIHNLAYSSENLTIFLHTPWNNDISKQFHAAQYFLESLMFTVCQEIQWSCETRSPVEHSQHFTLGLTLNSVNFCTVCFNNVL